MAFPQYAFIVLLLLACVSSCQKLDDSLLIPQDQDPIALAREQFRKDSTTFARSGAKPEYNFRQSLQRVIQWEKAKQRDQYIFVPVLTLLPEGMVNENGSATIDGEAWLTIERDSVTSVSMYELVTLLPDNEGKGDGFSGVVFMEDYFLGDVRHTTYGNGQITKSRSPRMSKGGSNGPRASGYGCDWVVVASVCVGYMPGGSPDPMCGDRYEFRCGWTDSEPALFRVATEDELNGSGGSASSLNPLNKIKPDCDGVTLANKLLNNQKVIDLINKIKNKDLEWGAYISLSNPNDPNSLTVGKEYTSGRPNSISFSPQWSASKGYHIGFIHNHPQGSAPSPSDIYHAALPLHHMYNDPNISNSQLGHYIDNFASIVISGGYVYTITIKHARNFSHMKGGFNQERESKMYEDLSREYLNKNPNATAQEAGEYALLRAFGDQIHLNKQKIGEKNNNRNIKLDNKKKVKTNKPC